MSRCRVVSSPKRWHPSVLFRLLLTGAIKTLPATIAVVVAEFDCDKLTELGSYALVCSRDIKRNLKTANLFIIIKNGIYISLCTFVYLDALAVLVCYLLHQTSFCHNFEKAVNLH